MSTFAITHDLSISLPIEAIVGIAITGRASLQDTFFSTKSQKSSVSVSVKAAIALDASIVDPPPYTTQTFFPCFNTSSCK